MSEINYTDVRMKEMVENLLNAGETVVTFTKTDGSERVLKCTLNESMIPSDSLPKSDSNRKKNDDSRAVWDLENAGWRSFRWDSVIEVTA